MSKQKYIFDNAPDKNELKRLQAIEEIFDPPTQKRLRASGLESGWQCLEVGAGAGSIAKWMKEIVGEASRVVAMDINPRFLNENNSSGIEVLNADIRNAELQKNYFDLVHARYVLMHLPEYELALQNMLACLKPGGWLVVEEPDFSAARPVAGKKEEIHAVKKVNRAIFRMFANLNMDYALGLQIPALFQKLGLTSISVENDAPLAPGNSKVANMMKMSATNLKEKYLATAEATNKDVEKYCRFSQDSYAWAVYYSTIAVVAQKTITN